MAEDKDRKEVEDDGAEVDPQALIDLFRSKGTKVRTIGPGGAAFGLTKGRDGNLELREMPMPGGSGSGKPYRRPPRQHRRPGQ